MPLECIVLFTRADWPSYPGGIRCLATEEKQNRLLAAEVVLVKAMEGWVCGYRFDLFEE